MNVIDCYFISCIFVKLPESRSAKKNTKSLLLLMIDVEGIRKLSGAPHLFGGIVTVEVARIFHTFQGGLRTAADLKGGTLRQKGLASGRMKPGVTHST